MNYIVLDLEFNQFFDFRHKSRPNPIKNCPFEIIQIGAVKLNKNFNITDKKNFYIKPTIYKRIHPFVQKITGINSSLLKDKPSFKEIYPSFAEFVAGENNVFCVWGGSDVKALYNNIKYHNLDDANIPKKHINVQSLACQYLKQPSGVVIGLKNAIEKFEIPIKEDFHNALNDAMYTTKILQIVNVEMTDKHKVDSNEINEDIDNINKQPKKNFNTVKLYKIVEKEFGRKLTTKEKKVVRDIYRMGLNGIFNYK